MARGSHLKPFCRRCQAANVDLFTPTQLRGEWILVPAADNARMPLCRECATVTILNRG